MSSYPQCNPIDIHIVFIGDRMFNEITHLLGEANVFQGHNSTSGSNCVGDTGNPIFPKWRILTRMLKPNGKSWNLTTIP